MLLPLRPAKGGNEREDVTSVTVNKHARRGGFGSATVLGACLLALSAWVSPAQAIEIFQPPTDASLAFSPTSISIGQFVNICTVNYNSAPASVSFVFKDVDNPVNNFNSPAVIAPGARSCGPVVSTGSPNAINILVSIVLHSPNDCSQATEYPGKCRVLGSVEIFGDIEGMFVNRIPSGTRAAARVARPPADPDYRAITADRVTAPVRRA